MKHLISVPCMAFRLQLRVDAVDEMDPLSIAILKCIDEKLSMEGLSATINLPMDTVSGQVDYLERLGFIKKLDGGLGLAEIGISRLKMISDVAAFNERCNIIFVNSATGEIENDVTDDPEHQPFPPLISKRNLMHKLRTQVDLFPIARDFGLPEYLSEDVDDSEDNYVGYSGIDPIFKKDVAKWAIASLDLETICGMINQTNMKKESVCLKFKASFSVVKIECENAPSIWIMAPHSGGKCIVQNEAPENVTGAKEADYELPQLMAEEEIISNIKKKIDEYAVKIGVESDKVYQSPIEKINVYFKVPKWGILGKV
jgi:hypothetical protein